MAPAPVEPLDPALLESLRAPRAHPHDASAAAGVSWIQTHISHVFLTRERVVKVRKAVALSFLSFATRAERNADCLRELRLNRRLAPDVYLGVAALVRDDGGYVVGEPGEALAPGAHPPEHAVVMRRLPEGGDALSMLREGRLVPAHLAALASLLARFHAQHGLGTPAPFTPPEWRARVEAPMAANLRALGDAALAPEAAARRDALAARWAERAAELAPRHEARRAEGRAVDGHGDLHLQHVWFEAGREEPLLIDCLEFDDALRRIDAASEVAFLAMDLTYRGRADLADGFLGRYAEAADDFGLYDVVDAYASYRAAVRAKVAALAAADAAIEAGQREAAARSASDHLALAAVALAARGPGPLVLLCGSVGSGKSTLARALADAAGAALLSSDRTRKRLAGLDPDARASAPPGEGLYTPARVAAVYDALRARARPVLASGRPVVLDASFARRAERDATRALARELGAEAWLVEARCAPEVARERLVRRARTGRDPSDAGPELLEASRAAFEPPDEWPAARRRSVATDEDGWREALAPLAQALRTTGPAPAPRAR